ncbi:methyltransferase domain-containing protein [Phaeodactylibacter xiamenensis]|uniref:methyltransferase domain-containing protein n=1 Tax=Phaeodactylibacter xiamenensis TaxID=1524460 RepID=UPI003CCC1BA2
MQKTVSHPLPPAKTIEALPKALQYIARQLEAKRALKPADMRRIVLEAGVQPEDIAPWADYGHPATDSYGRKLIYEGDHFEIMAMSWQPGDFSGIHDHGYTEWGAVQVFGPAEHATFRIEEGRISTLARFPFEPGDVVGVSHTLVHQMGNPTAEPFQTLHVYGRPEDIENVTGDARVYDLENQTIQRVDGGVFFALPESEVKWTEPGPKADFPTLLRYQVELTRRLKRMAEAGLPGAREQLDAAAQRLFSDAAQSQLLKDLKAHTNADNHADNSVFWRILNQELRAAALLHNELAETATQGDQFHKYAALYDELICRPCLKGFIAGGLEFFKQKFAPDFSDNRFLSIGAGTGLVERYIIDELGLPYDQLLGMDLSEAMVQEARQRIRAEQGDILAFDADGKQWDIAFTGLNVFHYLPSSHLQEAIEKTAALVKPGGYFLGDFITPDHIRWYPNVMYAEDQSIISLRTPRLIEEEGRMYQESEILNIEFRNGQMDLNYAGRHKRFLPPLHRVRTYFERAFGGNVLLYDAYSLGLIPEEADSCKSTRYFVVAQKAL